MSSQGKEVFGGGGEGGGFRGGSHPHIFRAVSPPLPGAIPSGSLQPLHTPTPPEPRRAEPCPAGPKTELKKAKVLPQHRQPPNPPPLSSLRTEVTPTQRQGGGLGGVFLGGEGRVVPSRTGRGRWGTPSSARRQRLHPTRGDAPAGCDPALHPPRTVPRPPPDLPKITTPNPKAKAGRYQRARPGKGAAERKQLITRVYYRPGGERRRDPLFYLFFFFNYFRSAIQRPRGVFKWSHVTRKELLARANAARSASHRLRDPAAAPRGRAGGRGAASRLPPRGTRGFTPEKN